VNLSARTQYACQAVLELALRYPSGQPVQLRKIAQSHGIPSRFLVQILQQLKAAGLIASVRGASGGYRLTKPPRETSLGEVIALIEGPNSHGFVGPADATSPVSRVLRDKWQEVSNTEARMLQATTLADLAEQVHGETAAMYYI
jgi:Rrf2 family protein